MTMRRTGRHKSIGNLKHVATNHHENDADWPLLYSVAVGCGVICTYGA